MRTPNRVTKPSPLFSLPREIRDQIYECVYPSRTHLPVTRFIWRNANYLEVEKAIFALRLVNRQISVEATFQPTLRPRTDRRASRTHQVDRIEEPFTRPHR